jgi:hypothetical protein
MTTLENLIKDTSVTPNAFAKMVGISPQALRVQLKSENHLQFAFKHAVKLGVTKLYGYENSCYVEILIKNFKNVNK